MIVVPLKRHLPIGFLLLVMGCLLLGCSPEAPRNTSGLQAVTAVPTTKKSPTEIKSTIQPTATSVSASATPPEDCPVDEAAATEVVIQAYAASKGNFVHVQNRQLVLNGQPFPIYGIDYYPRDTPWRRFLSETNAENLPQEFDLFQEVGVNTLRLTLRHDLLFQCEGNSFIPIADNIVRLDSIIQTAAQYHFHLILVLNDAPDLTKYPLYADSRYSLVQMAYLVTRYAREPAIIAWDLRDSGDADYQNGQFGRQVVLNWLSDTAIKLREIDKNHLITATWRDDVTAPIGVVDFVSLKAKADLNDLRQKIALLRDATDTPIVLTSVGYSTFGSSEEGQRDSLQAALDAAHNNHLAGWFVWTAFDFPLTVTCYTPGCTNADSADHHYGLWRDDYSPKLAVGVIRIATAQ